MDDVSRYRRTLQDEVDTSMLYGVMAEHEEDPRAAITLLTGRSVLFSGTRQLVIGLAAAGVTYGIGALIGTAVG